MEGGQKQPTSWHIGQRASVYSRSHAAWFVGMVVDLPHSDSSPSVLVEFWVDSVPHRKTLPACSAEVRPFAEPDMGGAADAPPEGEEPGDSGGAGRIEVDPGEDPSDSGGAGRIEVDPGSVAAVRSELDTGTQRKPRAASKPRTAAKPRAAAKWWPKPKDLLSEKGVVRIPQAEDRGITVYQLRALLAYIGLHCLVGHRRTQTAQAISRFVACLVRHREDRGLAQSDIAYWVCAYAKSQQPLVGDVREFPHGSAFYKVIERARGTITILDTEGATFSGVWCGYEIYLTLAFAAKAIGTSYLSHDIYTWCDTLGKAVGLVDGMFAMPQWHTKDFPIRPALEALKVRIETAEASKEEDRVVILNRIAGHALDAKQPLAWHPKYLRVNHLIRGRFAAGLWPTVLEKGDAEHLREFSEAIRTSGLERLRLDVFRSVNLVPKFDSFISALPQKGDSNLRELDLILDECGVGDEECAELARVVAGFGNLRVLGLRTEGARALAAAIAQLEQLGGLRLILTRNAIGTEGVSALVEAVAGLPKLKKLILNMQENPFGEEAEVMLKEAKGRMLDREVAVNICCGAKRG